MRPIIQLIFVALISVAAAEDLYSILGVSKSASAREIKKAYRKKALDTHPDKNKDADPEVAAEAFRKVVQAFEILSDTASRKYYDRTGRTEAAAKQQQQRQHRQNSGGGGYRQQFTWTWSTSQRTIRLKDKPEVRRAQARVIHLASLEQLNTIMLDDSDLLERNLLLCFVTPGTVQTQAEDEIVFPYPFAGMSSQKIWWEDLLQTAQVRFHRSSELSKFFNIPHADELNEPIFLFGKRGEPLSDSFARLQTSDRQTFEDWMWKQIQVEVVFLNKHSHPVEVYWIHGTRAELKLTLGVREKNTLITMLSHEWFVRDARVDTRNDAPNRYKLTQNSCLATWKITNDKNPQNLVIPLRTCFDLSGHCPYWVRQGECKKNPRFMGEQCRKTCNLCTEEEPQEESGRDEL